MTDAALLRTSTEYLASESNNSINFSAESSSDEGEDVITTATTTKSIYHHHKASVTALTLPEPLRASNEDIDKQAALAANALSNAALSHKLNSGIMYRDYISDSSDINSETSSLFEDHHPFGQSTGDLTLISKAVSIDTHTSDTPGSSAIVPAERNPVSGLLRSPSSVTSTDGEDSPAVAVAKIKSKRHSVPGLATSEYYSSSSSSSAITASTADAITRKSIKKKLAVSTSIASMSRHRKQVTTAAATTSTDSTPSDSTPQRAIVSNEEPSPPPSPTSHSALKKNAVHYDHKIIPDHPSLQQRSEEPREPTVLDVNATTAIPNRQQPRFITMEEELDSADDLFMSTDDQESIELNKPHNMSMMDLSQQQQQQRQETTKKNEIRSLEQRRSIKRLNAVKELMETEETYSRDLGILCTHFLAIIKEASCITPEESDILVRNSMEILVFQEKFTEALIEAHGDEEEEKNGIFYKGNLKNIAQCFVEWAPKFEIYLDYCVRQDHAVSVYNELLQTNVEFANLIERLHTFHRVSFGFSRLKFDDYLIIPFQRIFRYRLLLQSITKATQKDSEEYEILSEAQNTIHDIATKINNEKSKMEAKRKTALFLSRLDSDWCLPKRWFSTLGVCTLIGTLEVRCKGDSKAKRIGCALFNHYMIMAKAKKHKQYEPRYWFPLRKFEIENIPNAEGSITCSWLLRSDENTLELSAMCELEKHIWMEALATAIKESKALYSSSVDSNEYLLEQLFVSSFDQYAQPKQYQDKAIDASSTYNDTPLHFPMPNGSTSFSQSAIFNKPSKSINRASHPVFSTQEFSVLGHFNASGGGDTGAAASPGLRSQSSISDLREFFTNSVVSEKWTQRKFNQYHTRCKSVDTKFDDVCTTPILTARANSMTRHGSAKHSRKAFPNANLHPSSAISLTRPINDQRDNNSDANTISPIFHSPSTTFSESCTSGNSSRRPSMSQNRPSNSRDSMIFKLAQRNSSTRSVQSNHAAATDLDQPTHATPSFTSTTVVTAGLLQPASSTSTLSSSTRPARFFGRMVEKLGQIGTPGKRRNQFMSNSDSKSKPPTLLQQEQLVGDPTTTPSTHKKKFFPHFLQHRHSKK
ncbi:long-chain fatty acid-CoA ligase [Mucor velutinosus]|uniref:Long-chain fatty acid-CoA ligase n=1 Tax=Mucor velutinosus TaxID=708070 RepID=A0AAN7HX57_9FUNG|nr:long-chain fatty acid-CoA ligase [Mucor velutinosus]